MLAATLLPLGDGGQTPHVRHLLVAVEMAHEVVVIVMWHLQRLAGPDDELGGIGEVAAGDVGWRIGLGPCDDVESLETQLDELLLHAEDVVVGARNPYRGIRLHVITTGLDPAIVELVHLLGRLGLVPVALVHTYHVPALIANAAPGEEIRRVGKHHVEAELELRERFHAVALKEGEVAVGGFVE